MSQNIKWQRFWRRFKVFIILIIAVFAFAILGLFQGPDFLSSGGVAAMVNGQPVTLLDFRRAVENMERRMGDGLNSLPAAQRQMFSRQMRQQALSQLISQKLALQAAQNERIYVSDNEVMDMILNIPIFQENGNFNRQNYELYLENTRTSAGDFEQDRRNEILINRLQLAFTRASTPLSVETDLKLKAKNTELELEFVKISSTGTAIDPAKINASEYLANNEEEVKKYYEDNKSTQYAIPEKIRASHILIKIDDKTNENQARDKMSAIQKRVETEEFAKVATEVSEDKGSAVKGGSLGEFGRGAMVKEFETAAFAASEGELVGPVKTQFGMHLIKVEKKIPAGTKEFDSVKQQISQVLAKKNAIKAVLEELKSPLASTDVAAVTSTLNKFGLKWESTGKFKLDQSGVPKLGQVPEVVAEAMGLQPGQVANRLIQNLGTSYVVKLKSMQTKPSASDDEKSRKTEERALAEQRTRDLLSSWLESVQKSSKIVQNDQILAVN